MQILTRSSPWRRLLDNPQRLQINPSILLAPLQEVFADFPEQLDAQEIKPWQLAFVKALQQMDIPAWRISQLISDHNDWLYKETITKSLAEMQANGWGEPPVDFCILQLGSAARHESLLRPDQDNAMIIEDFPVTRYLEIDTWMQHLSEEFTQRLDVAGIPLCKGHVMARWPLWRKPASEWMEQMRLWTAGRSVKKVQLSNIFLDFNPVYGNAELAKKLQEELSQLLPKAQGFLNIMGSLLDDIPVALDSFDRLQASGKDAPHTHALNLKQQGLLPLQSSVRLLSIMQGVRAVGTRERLVALVTRQVLSPEEAEDLTQALNHLQEILLTAQLESLDSGRLADSWVDLQQLTERQKQLLRIDLKLIKSFVRQLRKKFTD
ncbi:DUF294 nucleotidyltransferase-like domain-containing protein [Marinospirillum insulare]|uniref:CBS domain-containing protein n=1 Tax=Marinospirillum insulare TaxID=217169 RepID=A0ABQ5ZWC4_9GAMM|nr:DUF294 nucleotidyltransferase-like domain-containing protein [Marinospirillum insulare]GLR64309.1 hypothetical protein GCM10007878_17470 [Marinospirillum insulare]